MRPTVVLLTPTSSGKELADRLRRAGAYQEGELFDYLDRETCRFGLDFSGDVIQDLDEEDIDRIRGELGDFSAITVEYSDISCIRDLLHDVTQGIDGLIDTNYGEILSWAEVLQRLDADPSWDWRSC
ncbi:hypothetical protein ACGFIE_27320 [Micromonospora sp. NPDC049275]|uniref:hypothetical protein n=1 Tax=Micromonospora sp. NPDC049275 TaxID=3364268 RepID=UPI00372098AD